MKATVCKFMSQGFRVKRQEHMKLQQGLLKHPLKHYCFQDPLKNKVFFSASHYTRHRRKNIFKEKAIKEEVDLKMPTLFNNHFEMLNFLFCDVSCLACTSLDHTGPLRICLLSVYTSCVELTHLL